MQGAERRAAVAAYKEQKVEAGVYTVRCGSTGRLWIGSAPNLATIWNRITFALRMDQHRGRSLQSAWNEHGADDFAFAVVERIEEEKDSYLQSSILKDRLAHWTAELRAEPIL